MKCINPATEEVIDRVSCDDRRTVHDKFRKLQKGQKNWGQYGYEVRSRCVARFVDVLERRTPELAHLLVREVGTPIGEAQQELKVARRRIQGLIDAGQQAVSEEIMDSENGCGRRVRRVPLGVVAHISTWNRPLLTAAEWMIPALLAGNTILYKPSDHATLTGQALVRAMGEAEIGEEFIAIAQGDGSVGDFVLDEPISGVAFCGTASTGKMVSEKLATRMIPHHIDAGATESVYICEDVDVENAARRVADRAFCSGGRGCRGVDRIYVHESVARRFTEALCRRVGSFDVGDPARQSTSVGPVVCARRIGQLEYQIGDAVQKGARLLLGGRASGGRGYFFDPTVLVDVDHRMLVMREESPGPVICVQRVCDDDEAFYRLEDVDHGLRAGMICRERKRAKEVLQSLDANAVYWWSGQNVEEGTNPDRPEDGVTTMSGSLRDAVRRFTRAQSCYF